MDAPPTSSVNDIFREGSSFGETQRSVLPPSRVSSPFLAFCFTFELLIISTALLSLKLGLQASQLAVPKSFSNAQSNDLHRRLRLPTRQIFPHRRIFPLSRSEH